jgi:pyruvate/2-oxoglutarate dehydrogenase complex dihydrolipoamide acyltransferase (E2) component
MFDPRQYVALRKPMVFRFHRLNCAPTVVIDMDVDAEPALAYKTALAERAAAAGVRVSLNHIVLKATAMALREFILFNYEYNGGLRLRPNERIDIRSPIEQSDLPIHVVVPETDRKSVIEVARCWAEREAETRAFVEKHQQRRLRFERWPLLPKLLGYARLASLPLQQWVPAWERTHFDLLRRFMGSFMVTNVGTLGVTACHGQLVKPSIAALVVLALREDVELVDGQPRRRRVLPLALEFDQKMADAGNAARFLAAIKRNLEQPEQCCEAEG